MEHLDIPSGCNDPLYEKMNEIVSWINMFEERMRLASEQVEEFGRMLDAD